MLCVGGRRERERDSEKMKSIKKFQLLIDNLGIFFLFLFDLIAIHYLNFIEFSFSRGKMIFFSFFSLFCVFFFFW